MFWCRDPVAPELAYLGHAEPRRIIELGGPGCIGSQLVLPSVRAQSTRYALFFKATLGVGSALELYEVGVDDDAIDWSTVPPEEICSFTDLDDREWRALSTESPSACALLGRARELLAVHQQDEDHSVFRDAYLDARFLVDAAHRLRMAFR